MTTFPPLVIPAPPRYRDSVHRFLIRWLLGSFLGLVLWAQHAVQAPAFDEAVSGARKFQLMPGL